MTTRDGYMKTAAKAGIGCFMWSALVAVALVVVGALTIPGCLEKARASARRQEQKDRERVERNRADEDAARKREGK